METELNRLKSDINKYMPVWKAWLDNMQEHGLNEVLNKAKGEPTSYTKAVVFIAFVGGFEMGLKTANIMND